MLINVGNLALSLISSENVQKPEEQNWSSSQAMKKSVGNDDRIPTKIC